MAWSRSLTMMSDAHGDANSAGALDLRAAHFDGIAVAYIFLDRRSQPGRGHIEVDRTGAEPPPQPAEAPRKDHQQSRDDDSQSPYPAFTGEPMADRSKAITDPIKPGVRPRQQPARAMAGSLVVFLIPTGIIPLRELDVSTRI
jgi:hypothetical protein